MSSEMSLKIQCRKTWQIILRFADSGAIEFKEFIQVMAKIKIDAEKEEDYIEVSVTETAPGLEVEKIR